jgi:hypothetical protein
VHCRSVASALAGEANEQSGDSKFPVLKYFVRITQVNESAKQFIQKWHEALEQKSLKKIDRLLAPDVRLVSPVAFIPFTDRQYILKVLSTVISTLKDFRYTRSCDLDDGGVLMVFEGELKGKTIEGIDLFDLDDNGRVTQLKVMLRPFRVYASFAIEIGERLGKSNLTMRLLKLLLRS